MKQIFLQTHPGTSLLVIFCCFYSDKFSMFLFKEIVIIIDSNIFQLKKIMRDKMRAKRNNIKLLWPQWPKIYFCCGIFCSRKSMVSAARGSIENE